MHQRTSSSATIRVLTPLELKHIVGGDTGDGSDIYENQEGTATRVAGSGTGTRVAGSGTGAR